jgi:site-specific recombinase XerD
MKTAIENNSPKEYKGFVDYFRNTMKQRSQEGKNCFNYNIALKHLENFSSGEITFSQLTQEWVGQLADYMKTTKGLRCEKTLSTNSSDTYLKVILSVIKQAADDRLVDHKVVSRLQTTPRAKADLNYLAIEELNQLASTPSKHKVLKNAFLFSCLTGLGWREVDMLRWGHIHSINGTLFVVIADDNDISVPLNPQAVSLMGTCGKTEDKVFDLHYSAALCSNLNKWAISAGVYRQITFTTAKQTFAMALLDQGVAIELISELLGHKHLKSTVKLLKYQPVVKCLTPNYLRAFSI